MSEDPSGIKMLGRRVGVIIFAMMVALLGANELYLRNKAKHKGAQPSNVVGLLRGEVDFTKPKLAESVDQRAALKNEAHPEAPKKSAKETLRAWMDNLLK